MEFEFKGKKENRLVTWFKRLSKKKKIALTAAMVILLLIIVVAGYVISKFSKIEKEDFDEDEIIVNEIAEDIGVGYTNFVLFGADSRDNDVTNDLNTDSIIIVSLNNETKEIKLLSVYRDTLMDLTDGNIQKCNSAYRRGGAKQALGMLNMNLDLNLQKYVTVNWSIVSEVVDTLGGVEVEVTEAEMKEMNKFIGETAAVANKEANYIKKAGVQTLDGVQATTYARIRKNVGNDYARTGRQRELIELVLKKAIKADLATINSLIDTVFPEISTNFTMTEVLKYASNIAKYEIVDNAGFPFDKDSNTLGKRGSCTYSLDLVSDVSQLHEFLFGTIDYEPSSKVQSISDEIDYIVATSKSSSSDNDNDEDDDDDDIDEDDDTTTTANQMTTTESETTTTQKLDTTTAQPDTTTEASTTESETTTTEQATTTEEQQPTQPDTPPPSQEDTNPTSADSSN